MDPNEKVYSESELIQMINGLAHLYWTKPWFLRIFHKPWIDALTTLQLQLAGDSIQAGQEGKDAARWAENYLNTED